MGQSSFAIALAERPDPRHIRAELIVDDDKTMLVLRDAGAVEAEIIGVGPPPHREQQV